MSGAAQGRKTSTVRLEVYQAFSLSSSRPVLRQNLIRLGRRTADAAATRQERRGTVDSASEAGRPAVWCPSGPTRERGGVQVGLPAALRKDGPEHGELIGLIRPPVGRSDGEGHRLRESR